MLVCGGKHDPQAVAGCWFGVAVAKRPLLKPAESAASGEIPLEVD